MTENMKHFAGSLKDLIKELETSSSDVADSLIEKLSNFLTTFPTLDLNLSEHKAVQPEIEQCAVNLWNFAVAKKSGGILSKKQNAKVRHAAANLVFACNSHTLDEMTLKKQIMMAMKTAKAWMDAGELAMAESPLSTALNCIDRCYEVISTEDTVRSHGSQELTRQKRDLNRDKIKVLSYQAEMLCSQSHHTEALSAARRAKELLVTVPHETCYLSMLCYNLGVEHYHKKNYEICVSWLQESFEIAKSNTNITSKNQARTLRLIASAYLEWNIEQHTQKALSAIQLANAEHPHPAGLYLKVKILILTNMDDGRLKSGFEDIFKHPELTADLGLNVIKLAFHHNKHRLAYDFLLELSRRYQGSLEEYKVSMTRLELLLQGRQLQEAKILVEDIITGHNTGSPLDEYMLKHLHILLWDQAAEECQKSSHSEALKWYNYSLSVFPADDEQSAKKAKLQRNRASCMINLGQYEKAESTLEEAEKCDPTSLQTFFLKFKTALKLSQETKAIDALQNMTKCCQKTIEKGTQSAETTVDVQGIITMAAQLAFEQSNRSMSLLALESVVEMSSETPQVLTALRCLCRLRLTTMSEQNDDQLNKCEILSIHSYVKTALEKLSSLTVNGKLDKGDLQSDATWFLKIAWNMALQCEDSSEEMCNLFLLCSKLTDLCPEERSGLIRQKTCLLMAAAASLQTSRETVVDTIKTKAFLTALDLVESCRRIYSRLEEFRINDNDTKSKDVTTPMLLILYEFEGRARLGDPGAEGVLERALSLPQCDCKVFETIAALALEPPLRNRRLSIRALQVAVTKILQMEPVDYVRCSKSFRTLIETSLQMPGASETHGNEETWTYFCHAADSVTAKAKGNYPELEILWLMTKAWNCGIHLYSTDDFVDAQRWCKLAMKLMEHLTSLKENYESKMTKIYEEVQAKLNPEKMEVEIL